ncbi:hypothetical protein ADEAN_000646600 [Angomonas deanei]|uniref:Uncharacterized protein n=1 Tax=Angomonas deanei TaxID=59799 RepID=A0A7G2CK27_9TRYP|nr:hypothetical protein ADEAN_000646600 [Angomonas deanei]
MTTLREEPDVLVDAVAGKEDLQYEAQLSQHNQMDENEMKPVRSTVGPFSCITNCIHRLMPPGGIVASAFSLAGGTIGAGILGLPAGSNGFGLVTALIIMVFVTVLTIFSLSACCPSRLPRRE